MATEFANMGEPRTQAMAPDRQMAVVAVDNFTSAAPRCSVVIPTRLRSGMLQRTLVCLQQQSEKSFEVVVVCDGEDPQTRALADGFRCDYPLRWLFLGENGGLSAARNAGAKAATGDLLVFLDDDTFPGARWVESHCVAHSGSNGLLAVCGRIVEQYVHGAASVVMRYLREQRAKALMALEAGYSGMGADFMAKVYFGANGSIRRAHFLQAGGFDPRIGFLGEEFEFGTRLYALGFCFQFSPDAAVFHQNEKLLRSGEHDDYCATLGTRHVYRMRQLRQCTPQTKSLTNMYSGSWIRRHAHRAAFHHPRPFKLAKDCLEAMADCTGSALACRLWRACGAAAYWEGVKEAGETSESLAQLARPAWPILLLHSISESRGISRRWYLSPARFERLLRMLHWLRFRCVDLDAGPPANQAHCMTLTFDDGCEDFYELAFPRLQQMGLSATVFIVVDYLGKSNSWIGDIEGRKLMSAAQVKELAKHGVRFGSHSLSHPFLTRVSGSDLRRETVDSKARLEDLIGCEVTSFAFPYGDVDARVRAAVAEAGYSAAVTTEEGLNAWEDPLLLKRINVADHEPLLETAIKISTGRDLRRLFRGALARGMSVRA